MECVNCNVMQRTFFCANCLKTHMREIRAATSHVTAERTEHVDHAAKALPAIEQARQVRSEVSSLEESVGEVRKETEMIKAANENARERIIKLKASISARRSQLTAGKALPPLSHSSSLQSFHSALSQTGESLARTRAVLVEELVDVFHIVEVGGRPPLCGTKGTRGEWMIGGLVLPVPGDMRRYPHEHINAALSHTLHFLQLLTFYLAVKLPFQVSWSGNTVGVGQPYLSAGKGSDSGGWARWTTKQPLHLIPASPAPSSSHSARVQSSEDASPSSSSSQAPSFTTALTMLLYNTLYLCHTQSLAIPLSQSGEVLRNLWALCCTPELGRRSHETGLGVGLEQPTPPTFAVEFAQLLQVTSAGPGQRRKRRSASGRKPDREREPPDGENDADGWDIVEAET